MFLESGAAVRNDSLDGFFSLHKVMSARGWLKRRMPLVTNQFHSALRCGLTLRYLLGKLRILITKRDAGASDSAGSLHFL